MAEKKSKYARAMDPADRFVLLDGSLRLRQAKDDGPNQSAGATVSVDNQVIGTSPAATSFVYYGTREFRIEKDGYRTETLLRKINPPWYEFPGLDFISESLWPARSGTSG